ncbi:hypothetical protein [Halomarina rubra]|uniref:C2H2-type domain-containing protein n=1 Tax=Halomarina rubra TaxID=2071873 RepID=A0ABD6ATH7_9EURY|nr:hypothetical protein [Halomarina rubra]
MSECPTCERDDFVSETGMKRHHTMAHGESLVDDSPACDCGATPSKDASGRYREQCDDCIHAASAATETTPDERAAFERRLAARFEEGEQ